MKQTALTAFLCFFLAPGRCPADPATGWRGNKTGLWPQSHPPLEWHRLPKGVLNDLRSRADRPSGTAEHDGAKLQKGLVPEWLVLGPFAVTDSVRDFNQAQLTGETDVQPGAGDKVGLLWKRVAAKLDYPWGGFGTTENSWLDLNPVMGGYKNNRVAYVHAYLFSPRGGTVRAVLEHAHGLKAWLNGKEVYAAPQRGEGMGNYYSFSRIELSIYDLTLSPRFTLSLKPGWNRLLLKVTTYNRPGWTEHRFCLRLMDLPTIPYESRNILWMTELPHRSNATPIVVADRIFVMAEPDELLCLDKLTGKVLWKAANNYYELLTPEERARPVFREGVEPLYARLQKENDFAGRQKLRTQIQKLLTKIDPVRFAWKADGHFEGHFGIVGFTTPTPVSDGKHVWVWCGNAVAACYDLDGRRRWITRVPADELSYCSSPALADGTLAVFQHKLIGLDAGTGAVRWEQRRIRHNTAAVLAAKIAGVPAFVSQRGDVVRARDGKLLYSERGSSGSSDTGWAPPVVLGDVVYQPNYGVGHLNINDFTGVTGDTWTPKRTEIEVQGPGPFEGRRVDRFTAGSPLIVGDVAYLIDMYSTFYAVDLKSKKTLYHHDTGLRGVFHYNALPLAASAALVGDNIIVQDNQGTALILKPGREFQQIAKNRIATQLDRYWPIPAQETIGYSPPVCDGNRMYVRGERYLYCIGEKGAGAVKPRHDPQRLTLRSSKPIPQSILQHLNILFATRPHTSVMGGCLTSHRRAPFSRFVGQPASLCQRLEVNLFGMSLCSNLPPVPFLPFLCRPLSAAGAQSARPQTDPSGILRNPPG